MTTGNDSGATGVRWDLAPLAPSEQVMKERLEAAVVDAGLFVERWPVESIASIEPVALAELLSELAGIRAAREEGAWWAFLIARADSENPVAADAQAGVAGLLPLVDEAIRHFELAWLTIPNERAEALAVEDAVAHDRYYLLSCRRFRPFRLSAGEERALAAREASARTAWTSLRGRTLGGLSARFDDGGGEREWSLSELQSLRRGHSDRKVRRAAWAATQDLLEPELPVLAQCYDAVVADRLAVDALRGHSGPMEPRNLENGIDGEAVEALLASAEAHYELGQRWFAVKARLLGLERLDTIDLGVPAVATPLFSWDEGHRLAVEVFERLTPTLAAEAERFFAERRIDAELRRAKPAGALCVTPSTRVPGFILIGWAGQLRDLVGLTHELGHGVHYALAARAQSDNAFRPGVAIGEVPSTFAQLRLLETLLAKNEQLGRAALAGTVEQVVTEVFLSTAFTRYEQAAYALRAEGKALTHERLSDTFDAELAKVWGDGMSDALGCRATMWAPLPHFVHERFYTYAYVFAFLLAAALLGRSHETGFPSRYERFLSAGGSGSPEELLSILGVDLQDTRIWDEGFAVIESWLEAIET